MVVAVAVGRSGVSASGPGSESIPLIPFDRCSLGSTPSTAHTDNLRGFWLMRAHNHTHIDHSGTETDRTRIYYVSSGNELSRGRQLP